MSYEEKFINALPLIFTMSLRFVGDIKIDKPLNGRISIDVVNLLTDGGQVIANLESPLTYGKLNSPKWASLKQSPKRVTDLRMINVKVVSLANNHMLDYGIKGVYDTLKYLDSAGILHAGAGKNINDALKPIELKLGSEKFHFYSLTTTLPFESGAAKGKPGVGPIKVRCVYYFDPVGLQEGPGRPPITFCEYDPNDMRRISRALKNDTRAGIKPIVAMHWGMAYQKNITDYQREIGHKLIENGAELVIGHHPHVLQEIEFYRGKMIFYSLGNFLWESGGIRQKRNKWNPWPPQYGEWKMSPTTFIADLDYIRGEYKVRIIPIKLSEGLPVIPNKAETEAILSEVSVKGDLKKSLKENMTIGN